MMQRMRLFAAPIAALAALLAAVALAACAGTTAEEPKMDTTVTLLPQHSTQITKSATLRYDLFEDSRCPPDVQCIWAGKLVYHFTLTVDATPSKFSLEREEPDYSPPQLPGVRIALAPVPPPPPRRSDDPAPPPPIPVTLIITRP